MSIVATLARAWGDCELKLGVPTVWRPWLPTCDRGRCATRRRGDVMFDDAISTLSLGLVVTLDNTLLKDPA